MSKNKWWTVRIPPQLRRCPCLPTEDYSPSMSSQSLSLSSPKRARFMSFLSPPPSPLLLATSAKNDEEGLFLPLWSSMLASSWEHLSLLLTLFGFLSPVPSLLPCFKLSACLAGSCSLSFFPKCFDWEEPFLDTAEELLLAVPPGVLRPALLVFCLLGVEWLDECFTFECKTLGERRVEGLSPEDEDFLT